MADEEVKERGLNKNEIIDSGGLVMKKVIALMLIAVLIGGILGMGITGLVQEVFGIILSPLMGLILTVIAIIALVYFLYQR